MGTVLSVVVVTLPHVATPGAGKGSAMTSPPRPRVLPSPCLPATARERLAWLLRQNRLHRLGGALAKQRDFVAAMHDLGYSADPSRVSRWEKALLEPPPRVLLGYERVLGLPDGSLLALAEGLYRCLDPTRPTAWLVPPQPLAADELDIRLHELLERALAGAADAGQWLELATLLPHVHLAFHPREGADELASRLITEMIRSVGTAYLSRFEALRLLVRRARLRDAIIREVGALVTDPWSGSPIDAVTLLSEVEHPKAAETVARLLYDERAVVRQAAVWTMTAQLERGQVSAQTLTYLEAAVVDRIRGDAVNARAFTGLVAHLPPASRKRVLAAAGDVRVVFDADQPDSARTDTDLAARLIRRVRTAAPDLSDDGVFDTVLCEALTHPRDERRHQAGLVLMMTPQRPVLARALVQTADPDRELGVRTASLLSYVASSAERPALAELLRRSQSRPDAVGQVAALWSTLAHLQQPVTEADLVERSIIGSRTDQHAMMYALGMTGSPFLDSLALREGDPLVAGQAMWWRRIGPALHH